jgi:two-component system, NarL family, response regulator DesR
MASGITVVVADDHPVTRAGTISVLQQSAGISVVGEASDGLQALEVCRTFHPKVLLLDVRLPKMEGLMVAHFLKGTYQAPRIIMFSAYHNASFVRAALEAGASGYLLKNTASADLLEAIQRVMYGQQVLLGVEKPKESKRQMLSGRELVTLGYVAEGMSTKQIALQMSSSTRTIETYLNRAFLKLGATNRTQAVTIARREQLLPVDEG